MAALHQPKSRERERGDLRDDERERERARSTAETAQQREAKLAIEDEPVTELGEQFRQKNRGKHIYNVDVKG